MKRALILIPVIGVITALALGFASSLAVDGGGGHAAALQIGGSSLTCDADGVTVESFGLEMDDGASHYVRISGISSDCIGAHLYVSVYGNATPTPNELRRVRESACTGAVGIPLTAGNTGANNTGNLQWCSGTTPTPVPAVDLDSIKIAIES